MTGRWFHVLMFCLLAASLTVQATAGTITFDFADSLESWEAGWRKNSTGGTAGTVSWSHDRGSGDSASLQFDMGDGKGDDGTRWIARQFPAPIGIQAATSVSFDLYNTSASIVNQFDVKAAILEDKPDEQSDFTRIGITNLAAGWVPFSYSRSMISQSGTVWVAVGIRVAWETHRDYWIDHVAVTGVSIPEPASVVLMAAGGLAVAIVRYTSQRTG